jgi:hypothetical protein
LKCYSTLTNITDITAINKYSNTVDWITLSLEKYLKNKINTPEIGGYSCRAERKQTFKGKAVILDMTTCALVYLSTL